MSKITAYKFENGKVTAEKVDKITHTYVTKGSLTLYTHSEDYVYFQNKEDAEKALNWSTIQVLGWKLKAIRLKKEEEFFKSEEYKLQKESGDRMSKFSKKGIHMNHRISIPVIERIESGDRSYKMDSLIAYLDVLADGKKWESDFINGIINSIK